MLEGPAERVFVVRDLLIECLPGLVKTPEVEQSEGLDGAVLYRRDAQTRGQGGRPVTASGAVGEARTTPIEPHRIEQMLIERDQVTAALQVARDALECTETVRIEVSPVGGTQGVHFQIVVAQLPGNGKSPMRVRGSTRCIGRVKVDVPMGRNQRACFGVAIAELHGELACSLEGLQRLRNAGR